MRALLVTTHYPPERTGGASRMADLASQLARAGVDVTVLAPPPAFPPGAFPRSWTRRSDAREDGVRVVRLWGWQPRSARPGFASRAAYYVSFPAHAALWTRANARKLDVVVCTMPPVFTALAGLAAARAGVPLVVDVRDRWIDAAVSLGFASERSPLTRAARRLERKALQRARVVTAVTRTLAEHLRAEHGLPAERVALVPNGVDTTRFRPVAAEKRPEIAYAGLLGHAQDLELALRALAIARRSRPDLGLVIAGDGETRPGLEKLARELGVAGAVRWLGVVPRTEVPAVLCGAVAALAPNKSLPTLDYAVPTKAYEALACGVPFIGAGGSELASLARESGGGLFAESRPEAMAEAMLTLLDDPDRAQDMGKRGRAHVTERYDRAALSRAFLQAIASAAEARE